MAIVKGSEEMSSSKVERGEILTFVVCEHKHVRRVYPPDFSVDLLNDLVKASGVPLWDESLAQFHLHNGYPDSVFIVAHNQAHKQIVIYACEGWAVAEDMRAVALEMFADGSRF